MKNFMLGVLAALCLTALPLPAQPCTTFQLSGQGLVIFGRNCDWFFSKGLILVNKQGVRKTSYPLKGAQGQPATWVSKYGSLTFNMYGREFPTGGMNSAGLVVESNALRESQIPPPDDRPYIASASLWEQYLLDSFATVAEILAHKDEVRLALAPGVPVGHLLISDAQGDCLVLEFLNGRMVTYHGQALPVRALTNSRYEDSLRHWLQDSKPRQDSHRSIARFKTAANMIHDYRLNSLKGGVDFGFQVLEKVAGRSTQWRVVYDQVNRRVSFFTQKNPDLRTIDLTRLDFSCRTPVMMIEVDAPGRGEVNGMMTAYSPAANRDLIRDNFGRTPYLKGIPGSALYFLAKYGDQGRCAGP